MFIGDEFSDTLNISQALRESPALAICYNFENMKTVDDWRRENLKKLVEKHGGTASFALKIDKSSSQISQWVNASPDSKTGKPRNLSSRSAREIERLMGMHVGELDKASHPDDTPEPPPAHAPSDDPSGQAADLFFNKMTALIHSEHRDESLLTELSRALDLMDGQGKPLGATAMILMMFNRQANFYLEKIRVLEKKLGDSASEINKLKQREAKMQAKLKEGCELITALDGVKEELPEPARTKFAKFRNWDRLQFIGDAYCESSEGDMPRNSGFVF